MRDPLGPMEPSLSPLYRILCFLRGVTALCPSYFKKTLPYPTQPATGNWVFDWQVSATVLCRLVGHEKEVSKVQFFGTEEFFFPRKPRCSPIHRGRVSPIPVSAGVFFIYPTLQLGERIFSPRKPVFLIWNDVSFVSYQKLPSSFPPNRNNRWPLTNLSKNRYLDLVIHQRSLLKGSVPMDKGFWLPLRIKPVACGPWQAGKCWNFQGVLSSGASRS